MKNYYEKVGLAIPNILLPDLKDKEAWSKWACVACDQYTSEPEYWEEVRKSREGSVSTYKLMLPEVYLNDNDVDNKIKAINYNMEDYLSDGTLKDQGPCIILTERKTSEAPVRRGAVVALDLERYDFTKGANALIRATEGTVVERIPPRMKIRKEAVIEMPHVMVLIDDPKKTVIEPLFDAPSEEVYDFDLMENGGHIRGSKISDEKVIGKMAEALENLESEILYAVGDGNHSLAAAKCHWEEVKKAGADENHPARFALVELLNIHDEGIIFHPIHRVMFNVNPYEFFDELEGFFEDKASYMECMFKTETPTYDGCSTIKFINQGQEGFIFIEKDGTLAVGQIQAFLDYYLQSHKDASVDYIHGEDTTEELSRKFVGEGKCNIGLILPDVDKSEFFETVIKQGALPRKTFSMGEAFEKRYYIECRKIR